MAQAYADPLGHEALDVWSDPRRRAAPKVETGISPLVRSLSAIAAPSVSGLDPRNVSLWADYSHWNGDIDLKQTAGYVDGIMTKASDGKQMYKGDSRDKQNYKDKTLDTNIQKAYDLGVPCIPYHYLHFLLDAGWTTKSIIDWQYDVIMEALKGKIPGKSFHAYALDIEEGGDTSTNAKEKTEMLTNRLTDALGVKIIHYSRNTILNQFPALRDWLSFKGADRNLWLAQYVFTGLKIVTWEQLYSEYISKVNMRVVTPGYATWKWVQFAACFKLPGCTVNYTDLNFYNGTKEQNYAWLGYKQSTPPAEPPPVVVEPPAGDYVTRQEYDALAKLVYELRTAHDARLAKTEARLAGIARAAAGE